MGGVQRTLKFVKYLPQFGWEPVVLTVRDVAYYAWDRDLLSEIGDTQIFRTGSLDPIRLLRLFKKDKAQSVELTKTGPGKLRTIHETISPWIYVPDSKLLWLGHAIIKIRRILKENPVDLVFTTSPPHSAHFLGLFTRKLAGIPWIADFRDDWLTEDYEKSPTRFHQALNDYLAKTVLNQADSVISVSEPISHNLNSRFPAKNNVFTIQNGFDPSDFDHCSGTTPGEPFTITYTGTLNQILNPKPFLESLRYLREAYPEIMGSIRIRFVGSFYGFDLPGLVLAYGLESHTEIIGYVSHRESVCFLQKSDLLLLILSSDLSEGKVTGKIFEYLGARKPVLALVPEGEAARLISRFRAGRIVHPDDVEGAAGAIHYYFKLWKNAQNPLPDFNSSELKHIQRNEQTRVLADIFNFLLTHC